MQGVHQLFSKGFNNMVMKSLIVRYPSWCTKTTPFDITLWHPMQCLDPCMYNLSGSVCLVWICVDLNLDIQSRRIEGSIVSKRVPDIYTPPNGVARAPRLLCSGQLTTRHFGPDPAWANFEETDCNEAKYCLWK